MFLVVSLLERLEPLHSCTTAVHAVGHALAGICPLVTPWSLEVSFSSPNDSTLVRDFR